MEIAFANDKVEKYFNNLNYLQKKVGKDHTKKIKQRHDQLKAMCNVFELLGSGLDRPHSLKGDLIGCIGWDIDANYRMIIDVGENPGDLKSFTTVSKVIIKGVVDYHGDKDNWIIH